MLDETCIFILSHNRADNMKTYELLKKYNTNIPIYILIDDKDPMKNDYKKKYNNVLVFNKKKAHKQLNIDTMDNFHEYGIVVYARNICFDFAKKLGYKYFIMLDDDYNSMSYRYEKDESLSGLTLKEGFDEIMEAYLEYLIDTGAKCVAIAQAGDYVGGINSSLCDKKVLRKIMNWFFFKTDERVEFCGTLNEDVNLYVLNGSKGDLFLTPMDVSLSQGETQKNSGGLTDIYRNKGTYFKSFYSVICMPSSVKIGVYGSPTNKSDGKFRIHHSISWNNTTPKIISADLKK